MRSPVPGKDRFMMSYPVSEFLDSDQVTVNFRAPLSFWSDAPRESCPECMLIVAFVLDNQEMGIQLGYDAAGMNRDASSVQPVTHILNPPVETATESGCELVALVPVRRVKLACNGPGNGISEYDLETAYHFENAALKLRVQFIQCQCLGFGRHRIDVG